MKKTLISVLLAFTLAGPAMTFAYGGGGGGAFLSPVYGSVTATTSNQVILEARMRELIVLLHQYINALQSIPHWVPPVIVPHPFKG